MVRIFGSPGRSRRLRSVMGLTLCALLFAGVIALPAFATTSTDAGFEGDDGNLAHNSAMDWNDFATVTWSGSAPNRTGTKLTGGWTFNGIEDWQATTSDSGFAGGTKQDDNCPKVVSAKAPNKDDLKRIYIANTTGADGHVYLALAWARIPQNTTSASAHAAFEFNQNDPDVAANLCPAGSDSLVKRSTANGGDMLIVYDFEGGSSPVILKLLRWKTSGTCEQTGKAATAAGCWVNTPGFTDWAAKVNTDPAADAIAPDGSDTLQSQEFGEAIIDLTDADVFPATPTSCLSFGRAFGVSRSSGNSGTAQMKDLVGPADVNISNCATVIIHKVTDPSTDTTTSFSYTKTFNTSPTTSNSFSLTGGSCSPATSSCTQTYSGNVFPKTDARVTESDPSGNNYLLTSITCTAASTATNIDRNATTGTVNLVPARTVEFDIAAGQLLECTFTNTRQKVASSMDTSPWYYPNDDATVTANAAYTDIQGSVKFRLYDTAANCGATTPSDTVGTGGLLYKQTVTLDSAAGTPKSVSTSNTSVKVTTDATVVWLVEYSGDTNHFGRVSKCIESINGDLTGDTGGTSP